jgi:hypothetical protein
LTTAAAGNDRRGRSRRRLLVRRALRFWRADGNRLATRRTRNLPSDQFIGRQELLPASARDWEWHNKLSLNLP